jgi:hypothetical protein
MASLVMAYVFALLALSQSAMVSLELNPEMILSWEFVEDYVRFKLDCKVDGY